MGAGQTNGNNMEGISSAWLEGRPFRCPDQGMSKSTVDCHDRS